MLRKVNERRPFKRVVNHVCKHDMIIHQLDDKTPGIGLRGPVRRPLHFKRLLESVTPERLGRFDAKRPKCQDEPLAQRLSLTEDSRVPFPLGMITSGEEPIIGQMIPSAAEAGEDDDAVGGYTPSRPST